MGPVAQYVYAFTGYSVLILGGHLLYSKPLYGIWLTVDCGGGGGGGHLLPGACFA